MWSTLSARIGTLDFILQLTRSSLRTAKVANYKVKVVFEKDSPERCYLKLFEGKYFRGLLQKS